MKKRGSLLKWIGIICSILGFGLSMTQAYIADKKLEEMVAKEVKKQQNRQNG